ncbi:UDP-2,3-diacylglucosamine diphosphatase LpxI [Aquifex pyrophilus]
MDKIGLIAGAGSLPIEFKRSAQEKGEEVITIGVERITDFKTNYLLPLGKVGKLLKILERENIRKIVMLGKFEHRLIYTDFLKMDLTAFNLLRKAKDKRPETLIKVFMSFLEKKGFEFIDPKPYLSHILAERGSINGLVPNDELLENGLWGFRIAKELASMDIGQTVVVKDKAVVAVEAMEGTQETIRRGGKLAGRGTVVIKVARKNQDFRIDVPTVGPKTLEVMRKVGSFALFLEAGKVFITEKEEFINKSREYRIPVFGLAP